MLDTPVSIRRAAMNLLARREHGHVELARKLRLRGADAEMIEVELQRLTDDGLLSEERYLEENPELCKALEQQIRDQLLAPAPSSGQKKEAVSVEEIDE